MLERKRRARINHCLDELKELLVGALQAEGESLSRLEKADVLELTVRHLHKLRRLQQHNENSASERFKAGFITCTNEVSKYMSNLSSSLDLSVSARLLSHLDHCIHQIEVQTANANAANMIPNGPLSSSSSTSTIIMQNSMSSQISPLHHHLAAASAGAAAAGSSPASTSTLSMNSSYHSLSTSSGSGSSSLSPTTLQSVHTRTSPNLNLLTTYTPPTSPISSPLNKLMFHPYAAVAHLHGHHLIAAAGESASTQSHNKSPSPAHIQSTHALSVSVNASAVAAATSQQMPLSLCTKPSPRMDRNNNEPFDLSNSMWRPW